MKPSSLVVKTFAYGAVTHTTVSRSRKPRGAGGATVETPGGVPEGNLHPYLTHGDRVRIEVLDAQGGSLFGAIDQRVVVRR